MNKSQVIENIREVAKTALPKGSSLLLYGSRARGDAGKDSDWDLLILLDKPDITESDYDNLSFPFTMLGWSIGEIISPQMYTKKDWESVSFLPFYKNVEHDKIVLIWVWTKKNVVFYALKIWFLHKNSSDIHDIRKNTQKTAMFLHNSGFWPIFANWKRKCSL